MLPAIRHPFLPNHPPLIKKYYLFSLNIHFIIFNPLYFIFETIENPGLKHPG